MALLVAHAAVSLYCLGLVWFVQLVHYPLFAAVGDAHWSAYHEAHRARTGVAVGPAMLAQLGLGAAIAATLPEDVPAGAAWGAAALTAAVFAVTFLGAVPLHERLGDAHDRAIIARLVRVNALRAALWTAHAALALWLVLDAVSRRGAG